MLGDEVCVRREAREGGRQLVDDATSFKVNHLRVAILKIASANANRRLSINISAIPTLLIDIYIYIRTLDDNY